jgi:hypothetical protein
MTRIPTITKKTTGLHDYDVGIWDGHDANTITKVSVYAVSRTQAAAAVRKNCQGFEVRDVNMVG